jgi:hypothetical protein
MMRARLASGDGAPGRESAERAPDVGLQRAGRTSRWLSTERALTAEQAVLSAVSARPVFTLTLAYQRGSER